MSDCSADAVLLRNVYSVFIITVDKKRVYRQYGKSDEMVKVIADHGNVLIVENKVGNRFPVEKTDIKINQ